MVIKVNNCIECPMYNRDYEWGFHNWCNAPLSAETTDEDDIPSDCPLRNDSITIVLDDDALTSLD